MFRTFLATNGEELFWLPTLESDPLNAPMSLFEGAAAALEDARCIVPYPMKSTHKALWPELWAFVAPNQQPRVASFRAHVSDNPSYFLAKALVLVSIRNELATRADPAHLTSPLATNGANNPLFAELASVFLKHQPINTPPKQLALAPRFSRSFWLEGFWGAWAQNFGLP